MNMSTPAVSAITTKLALRVDNDQRFADWQAAFTRTLTGFAGFLSIEIIPAFPGASEWRIVQRFRTAGQLASWRHAPERGRLIAEIAPLLENGTAASDEDEAPDFHSLSAVTEVIITDVKPGQEDAFRTWCETIQARQGGFPGYVGTYVQAPSGAEQPYWTTLVRFATPEQLAAWLTSPERREILRRSEPLVASWRSHRLPSPFAGWFASGPDRQASPPLWKQAILVLLVLYPIVMLEMRFLNPLLAGLAPAPAIFIGNAVSVGFVTWPLMPVTVFCFGWWLQPAPRGRLRITLFGLALLVLLYAVELRALGKLL
jgi:antibiotic biosynthesis monooxygenase (ABM) superfamily enzyme